MSAKAATLQAPGEALSQRGSAVYNPSCYQVSDTQHLLRKGTGVKANLRNGQGILH